MIYLLHHCISCDCFRNTLPRPRPRYHDTIQVVGDCMVPPEGSHAALLTVFGLQQLPDPASAVAAWVESLAIGGVAVICFWPMGSGVETEGPWVRLYSPTNPIPPPPPSFPRRRR